MDNGDADDRYLHGLAAEKNAGNIPDAVAAKAVYRNLINDIGHYMR